MPLQYDAIRFPVSLNLQLVLVPFLCRCCCLLHSLTECTGSQWRLYRRRCCCSFFLSVFCSTTTTMMILLLPETRCRRLWVDAAAASAACAELLFGRIINQIAILPFIDRILLQFRLLHSAAALRRPSAHDPPPLLMPPPPHRLISHLV